MVAIHQFRRSSSFTLGALFTGLLMIGVFFVAYFLVLASDQTLLKESEAAINAEFERLQQQHLVEGQTALQQLLQQRYKASDSGFFYALRNNVGDLLSSNLPAWPTPDDDVLDNGLQLYQVQHQALQHSSRSPRPGSEHYDIMARVQPLSAELTLLVGRNVDDLEIAQWVANTFGWLMIAILLLISAVSFWVGYYVVSRINRIANTTDQIITQGDLSRRLPVDSSWDDLSKLSMALNHMLDQLEDMVQGVKSVSDNIAHDLRTPLSRLRKDIEQLSDPEQRLRLLAEVDNILDMFNALLRIADIESAKQRSAFALHPLNEVCEDVVELYRPLAEQKQIILQSHFAACQFSCDKDLMFQAVANVLDNAIKFTPAGGRITVTLERGKGEVRVSVCDSGHGIAQQDREKVTRRFYRCDQSRTAKGNGLGMAMVAAVVHLHHGRIVLSDNPSITTSRGLCCTLEFPA